MQKKAGDGRIYLRSQVEGQLRKKGGLSHSGGTSQDGELPTAVAFQQVVQGRQRRELHASFARRVS